MKKYSYEEAYPLFLKGLNLSQIAERLKIPYDALQKYSRRHKWEEKRTKASDAIVETTKQSLAEAGEGHVQEMRTLTRKLLSDLKSYDFEGRIHDMRPDQYVEAVKSIDGVARKAFGLDEDATNGSFTTVQIVIGDKGPAIDIKPMPRVLEIPDEGRS